MARIGESHRADARAGSRIAVDVPVRFRHVGV